MCVSQVPAASKKDKEEVGDDGPPMKVTNGKEQRFKDEKNLKVDGCDRTRVVYCRATCQNKTSTTGYWIFIENNIDSKAGQ